MPCIRYRCLAFFGLEDEPQSPLEAYPTALEQCLLSLSPPSKTFCLVQKSPWCFGTYDNTDLRLADTAVAIRSSNHNPSQTSDPLADRSNKPLWVQLHILPTIYNFTSAIPFNQKLHVYSIHSSSSSRMRFLMTRSPELHRITLLIFLSKSSA